MAASPRPNIILCSCDQLRAFELGCYGHRVVRTPSIDKLAQRGVRFDVAISNAPVCTPARSCWLTGQHARTCTGTTRNIASDLPSRERIRLVDPTLPEQLKMLGYTTAVIGKWHVYPDPSTIGFDYALYPLVYEHLSRQLYIENGHRAFVVERFTTEFEIERVEEYIGRKRDRPFFLFYNMVPPHMPLFDVPEKYERMYRSDVVTLRENVYIDGAEPNSPWDFNVYLYNLFDERDLPPDFRLRDLTALYYGMVTCVDDMVGRLMQALERAGVADNTLVVFTSDHGDNLGSHHLFGKSQLFEESIRTPMIFHYPTVIAPGTNTTQVAQSVDIMPTILDLLGQEIPKSVQGRSLAPLLLSQSNALAENWAVVETGRSIGIRTAQYLYGLGMVDRKSRLDRPCLYDLRQDPYQLTNAAGNNHLAAAETDLQATLLEWDRSTPWLAMPFRSTYQAPRDLSHGPEETGSP